ncbi:FAD-dependent oxidoreductase [Maricaulis sp.]|uniref:flavin monoamine oxidase family protein n=1 Tax=Maricaulis sp. TaxID=1486257 RepID=UPI0026379FFF|nr:FAD-dependent oxidoreductase [Maricaulis sp.]
MAETESCDVIVIGAGLSGLRAAQLLARRHDVIVLEARDRVGGRALAHTFANGDSVDIGGQWVGPGQDRLYALIETMGMQTYPLWDHGDRLVHSRGRLGRYRGTIPKLAPHVLLNVHWMMTRFDAMAAQIDTLRPWDHPRAALWDSMTVAEWMRRHAVSRRACAVFAAGIGAVFAAEPHDVSLLHALFYARAGTSLDNLVSTTGGAQQDRVHGNMAGLADRVAQTLGPRVRLGEAARTIDWSGGVSVETGKRRYAARRAILAVPPSQAFRMRFTPDLPAGRAGLWMRMAPGACIKCVAQYETPFWRDRGLAGQAVAPELTVRVTFDNTEQGKTAGQLLGFIEGDEARRWSGRDPAERRAAVLDAFAACFGEQARHPVDYVDRDWTAEPFSRGCYAALMGPGVWTAYGRHLREPLGPVHIAGTEAATRYFGYFDGALEAAERAVAEVEAALEAS